MTVGTACLPLTSLLPPALGNVLSCRFCLPDDSTWASRVGGPRQTQALRCLMHDSVELDETSTHPGSMRRLSHSSLASTAPIQNWSSAEESSRGS